MAEIADEVWRVIHVEGPMPPVNEHCRVVTEDGQSIPYTKPYRDLIAASPKLLKALKGCVAELAWLIEQTKSREGGSVDVALKAGIAAIAAAEGK